MDILGVSANVECCCHHCACLIHVITMVSIVSSMKECNLIYSAANKGHLGSNFVINIAIGMG